MHHGRPWLLHIFCLISFDFLIQPRYPCIPDRILQNPYDKRNTGCQSKDPCGFKADHLLNHNLIGLIHDLDGQSLRNQRQTEGQTIFPIFLIDEFFALPPDNQGNDGSADDLRHIIADDSPGNQLIGKPLRFSTVNQPHGKQGSRNDRQQRSHGAELVFHHLFISSLHIQHAGVGKYIKETGVKHEIVHLGKLLYRFLKEQTQPKKNGNGNIG